ncbi:MAG: Rpn family recombination-promoting nuclease/putative transposase, partial [Lachnospiraceae bacterium]|nr:Rpn family recombination-promoting nuclease/putative transposase [Lachnospiraceae bacterium]
MISETDIQTHSKEKGTLEIKPFSELCLMDNYMFDVATLDIETCKSIIEIALHIRIKEIRWKENQKPLPGPPGKRGVRLDFIVVDEEGNWYDVEMQARDVGNLPKRTRFYRARQDSPLLNQGEKGFDKLPPMYIIFICDFDLFGYGKYRYTFQNRCREVEGLLLKDEVTTVFLNTQGNNPEEVEPELVEFLRLVKDNTGKETNEYRDNRVRMMYDKIKRLKTIAEMEVDYMASS